MTYCISCNKETNDRSRFCSVICSELHYKLIEKAIKMNHFFLPNTQDKSKCQNCGYNFIAHTKGASCEICNGIGPVEIVNDQLVCESCKSSILEHHIEANDSKIDLDKIVKENEFQPDYSISFKQDLYNLKVQSIEELRNNSDSDDSFIQKLAARYIKLTEVIHNEKVEQLVIAQKLRDFGNKVRSEIREQIRNSDNSYKPQVKTVKVSVKKQTVSPLERIVQQIAIAKGIDIESARQIVMSNPDFIKMTVPEK